MTLIAINVLLDPDAATVEKAQATNARLRENYPDGFALDANHAPTSPFSSGLCERRTSTRSRMLWPKCCVQSSR